MKTLFDICRPRDDVASGKLTESDYAADLAKVIRGEGPTEYRNAAQFFANTYPTEGLKALLATVCQRLGGQGGGAPSIFRLDTQYGGGKTHSLIALYHAARGFEGVANLGEFVTPELVPRGKVRLAAFEGENADPANGREMGGGLRAFTPWGEIAHALAGPQGYERVKASDLERRAPGAETLQELFGGEPTLILLDELSIYLRKIRGRAEEQQLTPFLTALFKAVESSPSAAVVFTLAIGKEGRATDAYGPENEFIAHQLDEAASVAARKATLVDPTAEHETARVVRRRLFKEIDDTAAAEVINAYREIWTRHAGEMTAPRLHEDREAELATGFPLHPALMSTLTDKLSTLADFQRVRGMLRLLTQAVAHLWKERPTNTYALHLHHLTPGFGPIRNELVTRLNLQAFDPAMRNDVAALEGGVALAEQLDQEHYRGLPPYASLVARTILWHTFAFNDHLKGLTADELRYAVLAPGLDAGFLEDARQRFVRDSAFLDDRPGAPMRFLTEANLNQIIRRAEQQVDPSEARAQLRDQIREVFRKGPLEIVPFPGGPSDVDDGVGTNGRPSLVLISYDAETVREDSQRPLPKLVEKIFRYQGSQSGYRQHQNHLVFLVADDARREDMRHLMVRRLALEALKAPERLNQLPSHQQEKVRELYQRSEQELAVAIQNCYRHFFFPSRAHQVREDVYLAHTAFDVHSTSDRPGLGQQEVERALVANNKLRKDADQPLAPAFVRDRTPLKKGQITTADLRAEFRKDPNLPILLGDGNFVSLIRKGVDEGLYVYKSGDLVVGQREPWAEIRIDQQSFVYTAAYAKEKGIWPRPAPSSTAEAPATGPTPSPWHGPEEPYPTAPDGTTIIGEPPTFHAEAPLREALAQIWEQARTARVDRLGKLRLRVFDIGDAFKLLGSVGAQGTACEVTIDGGYETTSHSVLEIAYRGNAADAGPLKEFLSAQLRAAADKSLYVQYALSFEPGLELAGDEPEKLTERLARFASGAAFLEATAEPG